MRYDTPPVAHTAYRLLVATVLAGATLAGTVLAAYEPTLDSGAIAAAIAIGQSRIEAPRIRFHEAYRVTVGRPPVDYVEVVTPFRRVAMAAEASARAGDRIFSQQDARAALSGGSQLEIRVEVTLHPLNTLIGVPSYAVTLTAGAAAPIQPRDIERMPRYGSRVEGPQGPGVAPGASGSQPMLGGTVIARYEGRQVNPAGVYDVVISEAGKEVARARIDLTKLR